jgi:hypothetical protein
MAFGQFLIDVTIFDAEHVERAWLASNQRTAARLGLLRE